MTNQNNAAQAAEQDPLSDEYVNAVIQRHGYQSPETVIARLWQWIGRTGGENGVTLLMYEAHKALVKLRAPVAEIHVGVSATGRDATICIMQPHADGSITTIYSATHPLGDSMGRAALASAPVADESPMAKAAEALREKARQERQAYQDRREADRVASAPVADAAPEYTYSDDGKTVTMTNRDRAPSYQASAPVASLPSQTRWPVLRAMSTNYTAGKHVWDALDAQACAKGAEEIKQLRAAISALASAPAHGDAIDISRERVDETANDRHEVGAPVAGEAQPVAECERCGLAPEDHTALHWCDNQSFRLGDAVQLGAAPQASEAVRDAGIAASEDVALPPLPSPPEHRGHAMFAGSQMQAYARAAVLADRQQDAIAWESTTPAYIKFITDSRYRKFSPAVRKWYRPYRCSTCAALSAQPGAQKESGNA
ncbi:MAG: hypothetical protein ACN6PJ_30370 [Achromobacter sp.]|uniref:hypothetical protein n=1 Tax=Achromobacter sp. TaxID=134375 RepID=UPI003CFF1FB0